MRYHQMPLSWTGTPLVALAKEKLILPLLTIDQSKMCKENRGQGALVQVCNEHTEQKMMLQSFFLQTMFIQKTRGTQIVFIGQFPLKAHHFSLKS